MHSRLPAAAVFVLAAAACSSSSSSSAPPADAAPPEDMSPTRPAATPVSPLFIGSQGFGFAVGSAFVGAAAPHGLAKVGPDTSGPWGTLDFLHCAGYWYGDDTIRGFSHLHLHGTGVPDYGVLGIMPTDAFDAGRINADGYASTFDKSTESLTPGKYGVTLTRGNIHVEIVATPHAAHHRFTFPAGGTAHVVVDLDHHLQGGTVKDAIVDLDLATRTARGSFRSVGRLSSGFNGTPIYFVVKTREDWSAASVWSQGQAPATGMHAQGTGVGFDLDFDIGKRLGPVEMQVGLSLVSIDAAAANLAAEMPAFDFDGEATQTANAWNASTGVVHFDGGTTAEQSMLTAALYHAFLMPTDVGDVDGTYVGLDGKTTKADGFRYVTDLSLWDTYRTLHPLYALIAPTRARDSAASLLAMAKANGAFPKWPLGDGESGTMIGASAEVVLADAYLRGVRGFDAEGAYQIMRGAAMDATDPPRGRGGRNNVVPYMKLGYVPSTFGASASWTIEYAQDDFALAGLAAALGHADDAATLGARSHGWQKLYDPASGLLWAKTADGSWAAPHGDGTVASDDFDEANAWQSVVGPWFDVDGLATVSGGREALVTKLETFFENGKADYDAIDWNKPLSAGVRRSYYWGGNEPDIHAPYLFALAGRPDLTQKWVRWIEHEVYGAGADGLPGNDDGGTMSAWLVFSALGFYPLPGSDVYVVGAPMMPHATIAIGGGTFTIDAPGVSDANRYVKSVTLNGAPLAKPTLKHSDLRAGGSLAFEMTTAPTTWGR